MIIDLIQDIAILGLTVAVFYNTRSIKMILKSGWFHK